MDITLAAWGTQHAPFLPSDGGGVPVAVDRCRRRNGVDGGGFARAEGREFESVPARGWKMRCDLLMGPRLALEGVWMWWKWAVGAERRFGAVELRRSGTANCWLFGIASGGIYRVGGENRESMAFGPPSRLGPNEKLSLPKRKILIIFRQGGVRASTIPPSAVVVTVLAWHAAEITRFVTNQTFVVYTCSHCKLIKLFIWIFYSHHVPSTVLKQWRFSANFVQLTPHIFYRTEHRCRDVQIVYLLLLPLLPVLSGLRW
jgi:hypothetical protein